MCGRFASFLPAEAIARSFGTVNPLPNLALSWNVAPTNDCAVVRRHPETGARRLDLPSGACIGSSGNIRTLKLDYDRKPEAVIPRVPHTGLLLRCL
jgi:hypothetical protein